MMIRRFAFFAECIQSTILIWMPSNKRLNIDSALRANFRNLKHYLHLRFETTKKNITKNTQFPLRTQPAIFEFSQCGAAS